jgi:hypothetical protein
MKSTKFLSGAVIITAALMFAGCYTQVQMRRPANDGYGYDRGSQEQTDQTPADSNYGDQYGDQSYADSSDGYVNNNFDYQPNYGSDYWYNSPRIYGGLYWSSPFYDPFYWDPYGLWAYSPGFFYGAFGYPYYHNFYYGYGNGYGYGYGGKYGYGYNGTRTRDTRNIRNNNGYRNGSGRGSVAGSGINNPVPTTATRTQPGTVSRSGNNNGRTYSNGRPGRVSRQTNQIQGRSSARYYNRGNSSNRNSAPANRQGVSRSAPQQRSSGSYSAPRSSSPPARAYSGSGSSGGSSRGSSGGGGGNNSSGGGRRGR